MHWLWYALRRSTQDRVRARARERLSRTGGRSQQFDCIGAD